MQKISTESDNCQGKNRTASDGYLGVQTFIGITENNLTEVQSTEGGLLEQILSPTNLNKSYKQVVSNKGSNGMGYEKRKIALRLFINGWLEYFKLADMRNRLQRIDEWYRRRLRMCIWKCWKKVKTRFKNLLTCGIGKQKAWEWANTRKGYWRIADSAILHRAVNNDILRPVKYPFLRDCYRRIVT